MAWITPAIQVHRQKVDHIKPLTQWWWCYFKHKNDDEDKFSAESLLILIKRRSPLNIGYSNRIFLLSKQPPRISSIQWIAKNTVESKIDPAVIQIERIHTYIVMVVTHTSHPCAFSQPIALLLILRIVFVDLFVHSGRSTSHSWWFEPHRLVHRWVQFVFGLLLLLLLNFPLLLRFLDRLPIFMNNLIDFSLLLSGRFLLSINSIVGLRQLQNFIDILVVIRFSPLGWQSPSIESMIKLSQRSIFQQSIRSPRFVYLCKLWYHTYHIRINLRRLLLIQIWFNVIGIQQYQQQKLFILILLKQRNVVSRWS